VLGLSLCREGKFAEAERLYGAVLQKTPNQFDALLNLGRILLRRGKAAQALDLMRRAVAVNPQSPDASIELGNTLTSLDRHEDAVGCYQRSIALRPNDALAHAQLGTALLLLGRNDAAIGEFRTAIALKPQFPQAHHNLGIALVRLGRLDEAIEHFRTATTLDPTFSAAFDNLAAALRRRGRFDEAVAAYRQSISLKPDNAAVHDLLGATLQRLGRYREAVEAHKAALAIAPGSAPAHRGLGNALFNLDRHEEAVLCYQRSIALKPDYATAFSDLGLTLDQLGRRAEALDAFEKAFELAPENIEFHYKMMDSKRFAAGDRQLETLERMAEAMPSHSAEDQIRLHFILAKAYDDLGDPSRAFEHLANGNALVRRTVPYDEVAQRRSFERIHNAFDAELIRAKSGMGHPSAAPVFILGMPRSGTTLVEQILAAHPGVSASGELTNFPDAVAALKGPDGRALAYPELARSMNRKQLFELGAAYIASLPTPLPLPDRITDKMPGNFTFVGLIHLALPNARIIHVRRDPLDTCFSCYSKLFLGGHSYSYDLGELGRFYRDYERLMAHWSAVIPVGTMLDIQYEELVGDFEGQARRLVAHCGLEWDARCLAFHDAARPVRTASFTQVRRPLYSNSISRSRPYKDMLGPLVEALAARAPIEADGDYPTRN